MQSAVQAQNKRPLTTSQHPGLVILKTVLFVWLFKSSLHYFLVSFIFLMPPS